MAIQHRSGPVRFDPFYGDDRLRRAYVLLYQGAWADVETALDHEAGWMVPSILPSSDAAVETVVFARFAEARPTARSLTLLGGACVRDAFEQAEQHPDGSWTPEATDELTRRLNEAEDVLRQAIDADPELADPWVHLLASGRGLRVDLEELRHRFEEAHERAPFRPDACFQYLLGLAARSGGSDLAMFDFARWLQDLQEPGSPSLAALPMAHIEHGLGPDHPGTLTEHLATPEANTELTAALSDFLWHTPSRSDPDLLAALNCFALAVSVVDPETATLVQECFRRIANRPTSYPWDLDPDEPLTQVFTNVQRSQLRRASRLRS